jgi:hypothetical protein
MRVNESKKIGKISDEIITFLVHRGYEDINYHIAKNEEHIAITITVKDLTQADEKLIQDTLDSIRSLDVEEYSWELLGESSSSNELGLVGMLFDSFNFERVDDKAVIRLIRLLTINTPIKKKKKK